MSPGPPPGSGLDTVIADVAAGFSGRFGLYTENLATGEAIDHGADQVFHSASTIKLAILTALFRRAAAGGLDLDTVVPVQAENITGGSGVLAALGADVRLSLYDLAVLMTVVSDNTATNQCIDAVGIDYVNDMLDSFGLADMRLHRKVRSPGAPDGQVGMLDVPFGEASPRSLGRLMAMIVREEAAPPDACAEMLSIMRRQQQNTLLTRYLPDWEEYPGEGVPVVASKSGRIRGVRHDVGAIWHRGAAFVIAIMSDGCHDERYHPDNEALLTLPRLSEAVFQHWLGADTRKETDRMGEPLVVLQVFHSIFEADQLASLVQSGGWPATVRPARGGGMALTGVLPGHEVLVPASAVDEIAAFLQADPSE